LLFLLAVAVCVLPLSLNELFSWLGPIELKQRLVLVLGALISDGALRKLAELSQISDGAHGISKHPTAATMAEHSSSEPCCIGTLLGTCNMFQI